MRLAGAILGLALMIEPVQGETVRLFAAGSLKAAMADIAAAYEAGAEGEHVETVLGASGLLRERIENGETAHLFASADTGHPKRLADQGRTATPVAIFARNQLCALVRPGLAVTTASLLQTMLDPSVRVGISTPKADPSGDYAFALFAKAEAERPGARAALEAKALQLTGGPASERAPEGRNFYGWAMASDKADIFLTYCTNAIVAKAEVPELAVVQIAPDLNVGADYGLVVLRDAPPAASKLAAFIVSEAGRALLARHGFGPGDR